jgi:hypothetical protein
MIFDDQIEEMPPHEDRHKAPASALPFPLSLQHGGTSIPYFDRQNS